MKLVHGVTFVVVVNLSLAASGQQTPTPQEEYAAIFKRYSSVSGGLRTAQTDLERKAAVESMATFASEFVDLAARHPRDPDALNALRQATQVVGSTDSATLQTWEMNTSDFAAGCSDDSDPRTVSLVLGDHIGSDKLGPVLDRMRYAYRLEYEECLQNVLEKNPYHEVRGLACLALAQYLNDKVRMLQLVNDRRELAECYEIVFGKEYLTGLRKLGQADLAGRVEALFERAANKYADVKFRGSTVGEWAKSELYDIRHLSIGKVAPGIKGRDQDGVDFQLSDYRNKVVLLYFWSEF